MAGLVSPDEAAKILGVSAFMIREYCRERKFKTARKVGSLWRIEREEILNFGKESSNGDDRHGSTMDRG